MMGCQGVVFSIFFLLKMSSVYLQKTCPPPNYPLGGSFSPKKHSYRIGDRITYSCENHLTLFGEKENVCNTKWIQSVPFCDSPTKLKNPSSSQLKADIISLVDGKTETCVSQINTIKVFLENPAPLHSVRLFLKKGLGVSLEIKAFTPGKTVVPFPKYERYIEADDWVDIDCHTPEKIEYITFQDKHSNPNILTVCEVQAFVKDNSGLWCLDPPRRFIENGALEVSRNLAILHCADGYKASADDRLLCNEGSWEGPELVCKEIVCENSINDDKLAIGKWVELNEKRLTPGAKKELICPDAYHVEGENIVTCLKTGHWTKPNATCVVNPPVKASSSKIIGITVGVIGLIVIFFFMGLTVYLLRKRGSREVVVVYKPESSASPTFQESEYSTIYYGSQTGSFTPLTPPKPPHIQIKVDPVYAKPYTEKTPVDMAFGTLKTSSLYDALND